LEAAGESCTKAAILSFGFANTIKIADKTIGRKKFCVFGHHLFSANQLLATASAAFLKIQLHLKLPHLATFVFDHLQRITHAHKAHWIRYLPPVDTDVVFCVHAPTGGDAVLVRDKIHI